MENYSYKVAPFLTYYTPTPQHYSLITEMMQGKVASKVGYYTLQHYSKEPHTLQVQVHVQVHKYH